ncbi:hypothetical protein [Flavobacterium sp.]|uniref:hypothetical protein n=1 Tax=Flavobacterium sp. TaxID=239 RepID=UPI002FD957F2
MKVYSFFIVLSLLFGSCKNEKATSYEISNPNKFEKDWSLFQDAVVNKTAFDWNTFVEIEGQLGEDYIYLFENQEAIEVLKKTKYKDLYDATLFNEPIKQLTIGTFDEFSQPEGYVFYFKETDRGLKLIGFESL